jgi:hypothetical protein
MWTSEVGKRLSALAAGRTDNALNLSHSAVEIVVDHHSICSLGTQALFFLGLSKTLHHVFGRITTTLQTALLLFT